MVSRWFLTVALMGLLTALGTAQTEPYKLNRPSSVAADNSDSA